MISYTSHRLYQVKTQKNSLFKDEQIFFKSREGMLCKAQGGKAGWFLPTFLSSTAQTGLQAELSYFLLNWDLRRKSLSSLEYLKHSEMRNYICILF